MVSICIKSKPSQKHCLILEPMYENQFQASQLRPTLGHCNEKVYCTSIARAFKVKFNKGSIRNMRTIILGPGKLVQNQFCFFLIKKHTHKYEKIVYIFLLHKKTIHSVEKCSKNYSFQYKNYKVVIKCIFKKASGNESNTNVILKCKEQEL